MNYTITDSKVFPLVEVTLQPGEQIRLERGAMVYHNGDVSLEGKMNSNSGGIGGIMKAVGRSMTSGESMFMTTATGNAPNAKIGLAPDAPGQIRELQLGASQWRLNDKVFLACDTSVQYEMRRQSVGKALFGGTGGLFVMETSGNGSMLINSFGDIMEFQLDGTKPFVVDNTHVVAWSANLQYELRIASGTFGFTTGEGLVNEFHGTGTVLLQTRNVKSLADMIRPFVSSGS